MKVGLAIRRAEMADTPLKTAGVTPLNDNKMFVLDRKTLASKPIENITPDEWSAIGHAKRPSLKVIRHRCIDCCAGSYGEVKKCEAIECPSWPYRTGKNPFRQKGANDA